MRTRDALERALLEDLEAKREIYNWAKENFQKVPPEVRIGNASRNTAAALDDVLVALREFNEFVLHGVIPERWSHLGPDKS